MSVKDKSSRPIISRLEEFENRATANIYFTIPTTMIELILMRNELDNKQELDPLNPARIGLKLMDNGQATKSHYNKK